MNGILRCFSIVFDKLFKLKMNKSFIIFRTELESCTALNVHITDVIVFSDIQITTNYPNRIIIL